MRHLRPLPPRGQLLDVALASAMMLVGLRYLSTAGLPSPDPLVPLAAAPLAVRRRWPLAVLGAVLLLSLLVMRHSPDIAMYAGAVCMIAAYTVAAHAPLRWPALTGLAASAAVLLLVAAHGTLPHFPVGVDALLFLFAVCSAGYQIRSWRQRAEQHRAELTALELAQLGLLDRAVEQERARIARELHDVVTHNVSVMVIQAGAARKIMESHPAQAREAMAAVESGGRAAMTELRQVMGLLSEAQDTEAAAELDPQPGLHRLSGLVDRVRRSGMPVELTVRGEPRPVPPGVELAAYRVVQEALTNTIKHAGGASSHVLVAYEPGLLRVDVRDSGGTPAAAAATGSGRGLVGLRERVAVHGGTLDAGPRPTGGFRITAVIPLAPAAGPADPQAAGPQGPGPQSTDPQSTDPQSLDPQTAGPLNATARTETP